jgi:hypothetical protein
VNIGVFLELLENMPVSIKHKLKIGENKYALKQLRESNLGLTMQDIKNHNIEMEGFAKGYEDAVNDYKKWRNQIYLTLKNLN